MIYFLRHGETIANEQNYLAGILNPPLSDLGLEQAKEAGTIILKKGLKFDEVHVSNLSRTKTTALIALEQSGQQNIPLIESPELMERNFGVFTGLNKNLLKKFFNYKSYEKKLHSSSEFPESGETFEEMYERVYKYYFDILLPQIKSGKSILVVCHKYIIEMFALIFSKTKIEDYFDFRLPNAKPMSKKELVTYVKSESKFSKEFSDRIVYHTPIIIFIAVILGIITKTTINLSLTSDSSFVIMCVLLGINTFFISFCLNIKYGKQLFKLEKDILIPWGFRFILAGVFFFLFKNFLMANLIVLFLMPPALATPTFSLLWGGNLNLSIEITFLLSLLSSLCIAGLLILNNTPITSLFPFFIMLVCSMIIPLCIAQFIRIKNPIESHKFSEHWKGFGVFPIVLFSFFSVYYFTPVDLFELLTTSSETSIAFLVQGLIIFLSFILIKIFAYFSSKFINRKTSFATDIYITHSTPNIFLWIACFAFQVDMFHIAFWVCVLFFSGILVDEKYFVTKFKKLITQNQEIRFKQP